MAFSERSASLSGGQFNRQFAQIGHNSGRQGSMYAITFDLDTDTLRRTYSGPKGGFSSENAYSEIRAELKKRGFGWVQGSVYFGDDTVDSVTCVLAVQELTEKLTWFGPSVRDIRMLRIEENNNLMPAIERAVRNPSR